MDSFNIKLEEQGITSGVQSQLLKFLKAGFTTQPLLFFFRKDLYNTKILQKLNDNLQTLLGSLIQIMNESVMNVVQRLVILLSAVAVNQEHLQNLLGLCSTTIESLRDGLSRLDTLGQGVLRECLLSKYHTHNFLIWLDKCVAKSSQSQDLENEQEVIKNELSNLEFNL